MSDRLEAILWPLSAALLAAWVVAFPLTNTDIWWHLASGRHIVEHGLPDTDPFSSSARGVTWVNIHWLFQLAAYGAWSLGEELALVFAKVLTCAVAAALLVFATPARARGATVLVLVAALFAVRHLVMARPIVVTLFLLAACFFVLERYRTGRDWRFLSALPLLQVLWVNTQGLHTLGPVLVAIYLLGASLHRVLDGVWPVAWRALGATLGATVLASFASPYGVGAALLPWKLFARIDPDLANIYALNVSEFVPPWHLERGAPGTTLHLTGFLLLLALAHLLARRRILWAHVGLMVVFAALALMANRNVLLLYWLGAPILASAVVRGLGDRKLPRAPMTAAAAALAVAVVATHEGGLREPAPFRVPAGSAALLADLEGGRVFCSVRYGGYLGWRLHPRWTPYIDGRLVLRTRAQFAEYLQVLDEPRRFDEFRARHDLVAAVLPTAFPRRYLPLVGYLIAHPDWRVRYTDGTEVLLVYRDAQAAMDLKLWAHVSDAREMAISQHPSGRGSAVAIENLARLVLEVGRPVDVRQLLADAFGSQLSARARSLVARSHYLEGDLDLAAVHAERRLSEDADDIASLTLLALIAVDRGEPDRALSYLGRVFELDPYNHHARELLRRLEVAP